MSGALHQELCKATHFGDIERNRNIFGIQAKRYADDGVTQRQDASWRKQLKIRQIMINNNTINVASQYFKSKVVQTESHKDHVTNQ
jgi:hypothetical protein